MGFSLPSPFAIFPVGLTVSASCCHTNLVHTVSCALSIPAVTAAAHFYPHHSPHHSLLIFLHVLTTDRGEKKESRERRRVATVSEAAPGDKGCLLLQRLHCRGKAPCCLLLLERWQLPSPDERSQALRRSGNLPPPAAAQARSVPALGLRRRTGRSGASQSE